MKPSITSHLLMAFVILCTAACDKKDKGTPTSHKGSETQKTSQQDNSQNPEFNLLISTMRKKQAAGLGTGSVKVNSAWAYTGHSTLKAVAGARLVAVDTTVTGHTSAFDFDDIEIIDGANRVSYGSDPHIILLSPEGKALPNVRQLPTAPDPVRVLLIYGFPKETQNFTLYYWGKNLLAKKHSIESSGWELPFPKTEAN